MAIDTPQDKPRARRRRRWKRAALLVFVLLLIGVGYSFVKYQLIARSGEESRGTPPADTFGRLPDRAKIAQDTTYKSEGSQGGGGRVLLIYGDAIPDEGLIRQLLDDLQRKGWMLTGDDAALSPGGDVCMTADPLTEYLKDSLRPVKVREKLRSAGDPAASAAVLTAIFC